MIDLYKVSKFIKSQWLAFVLLFLWVLSTIMYNHKKELLIKETEILDSKINKLNSDISKYKIVIDSLKVVDTVIVTKIKTIKQKEYEKIRVIDSLPISGLQSYFTERYPK